MAVELTSLADVLALRFDDIIDVRAPAEFADDHLPGALSLPVLDDAERARVGTLYKQVSPFDARKLGAALVAKNAAAHLMGPLADRPGSWQPLVYCWRGGQRSGSFATILSQIGWRVQTVQGGYKSWRSLVVAALQDQPFPCPVVVLDGNTGTAKTALLAQLAAQGVQVLDLEALAGHRGSLFGAIGPQPSQRRFEGQLALAMARLDPKRPVVIEAESSRIGRLNLPRGLWRAMTTAPRITLDAPLDERARYLAEAYADIAADAGRLTAVLGWLRPSHPGEVIAEWEALAEARQFTALARSLMQRHYDPRYAKHRARSAPAVAEIHAPRLDAEALPDLARRIAQAVPGL